MAQTGIIPPDASVELLNGEIIEMSPIGPAHSATVALLHGRFVERLGGRALCFSQSPLALDEQSEPERAGSADLHLSIDARFQSGLGLGPLQSGELRVEVDGLSLHMDRETAQRANGIRIDAVDTGQGPQLSIDNPNAPVVGEMGPGELKALLDAGESVALFDVRPADEAAKARIPGARLLDAEGEAQLASLPRDARIVFHCHHGGRSQAAAERYASLGFRNVYNLVGGVDAWSVSVDPSLPRY